MSEPMSREQVLEYLSLLDNADGALRAENERLTARIERLVVAGVAEVLGETDEVADLTAQLAAMTQERDQWCRQWQEAHTLKDEQLNKLQQQLAASEATVKKLDRALTLMSKVR